MLIKILMAITGAGKTTLIENQWPNATSCSADHFFEKIVDGKKVYDFQAAMLPKAHGQCLTKYISFCQMGGEGVLVVDNTNTTIAELAPYVAIGQAYGHDVEIIHLDVHPTVAWARNVHGVPMEIVTKMHDRLQSTLKALPPWWKLTTIR